MRILETARLAPERLGHPVNYCHFAESLADLADLAGHFAGRQTAALRRVEDYLCQQRWSTARREALLDVLTFLVGPRGRRVSVPRLERVVAQGSCWRPRFLALECRGFSYRFSTAPRFRSIYLGHDVNLRAALVSDRDLYYPPRVRQALTDLPSGNQHILGGIGWVLGQERQIDGQTWWYLINIQSDITHQTVSCLREIFRGWQRVLFWLVLRLARQRGVWGIALPPAAYLPFSSAQGASGGRHLDAWRHLYDGVASFFGLQRAHSDRPINIQPMRFLPEKKCSVFYTGRVNDLWKRCARSLRPLDE